MANMSALIVDNENSNIDLVRDALGVCGINDVHVQEDSREVMAFLHEARNLNLIFLDLNMPHLRGQNLLAHITSTFPRLCVIIMTTYENIETAAACTRVGADYYILKPLTKEAVVSVSQRALTNLSPKPIKPRQKTPAPRSLSSDSISELRNPEAFSEIIAKSKTMCRLFKSIEHIAMTNHPILITGETGVGKELAAETVHKVSGRTGRFVPVNVAGLDEHMFSDTLFGHRKGAFTGAISERKGLVESADGGTLFLDEIGDLQMGSQVKLLRLLQQKEYYSLGADRTSKSNARILTATNQDLEKAVNEGRFRSDLYYRLRTHAVNLAPLRDRKEDIPLLLRHFVKRYCSENDRTLPYIPTELDVLLRNYHFPGNIRELEAMVMNAMSYSQGSTLSLETFKEYIFDRPGKLDTNQVGDQNSGKQIAFGEQLPTLKEISWLLIQEAMKRSENNQTIAAQMLGISQQALSKRLRGNDTETSGIQRMEYRK